MKTYAVDITPSARADVREAFAFIHAQSPENAERWLKELWAATDRLKGFAGHARASESDWLDFEMRSMVFKSHRIIYSVDETHSVVSVHYVRHQAQRGVGEPPPTSEK